MEGVLIIKNKKQKQFVGETVYGIRLERRSASLKKKRGKGQNKRTKRKGEEKKL